MEIDHLPGTDGVVRFPVERRAKPTLLLVEELAPRSDLVDAMADERAGGEERPDTLVQAVEAFTALAGMLEFSMGVDAALAHLRAMNEVQVERACALGWAYRDAEAAAEAAELKLRNAKAAGFDGLLGGLHEQVRRSRAKWMACALAARAAADAARGAKEAFDCHERGEPWRRSTGEENGMLLFELQDVLDARRRAREGEPV
jgi:hypothetical protein